MLGYEIRKITNSSIDFWMKPVDHLRDKLSTVTQWVSGKPTSSLPLSWDALFLRHVGLSSHGVLNCVGRFTRGTCGQQVSSMLVSVLLPHRQSPAPCCLDVATVFEPVLLLWIWNNSAFWEDQYALPLAYDDVPYPLSSIHIYRSPHPQLL